MRDGDELDLRRLDADAIELLGEGGRELPARRTVLADAALLQLVTMSNGLPSFTPGDQRAWLGALPCPHSIT